MSRERIMHGDIAERDLLRWALDYTLEPTIEVFRSVPDEEVATRPRPNINAPGWIFGHSAVTERVHVGRILQGVDDVPDAFNEFRSAHPTEEGTRAAIESKEALIDYWREVRAGTVSYLESITDADLGRTPESPFLPEDQAANPIREWFIMTVKHQNEHWGQLEIITKLLADDRRTP